ncbi:MAG: ABC transporter substrate-binding protein [bacterium]
MKSGGTYRIPVISDITSLDPISGQFLSWTIGSQIFEGLVTYSRDESRIIPLLAESYEINDLRLTFHLRQGIHFHDDACFPGGKGRELTANDVKYSFERGWAITSGHGVASLEPFVGYEAFITGKSPHVTGFRVVDKFTFQIQLTRPNPGFLNDKIASLGFFIVPREAVDFYGEDFKLHPVGTGPFRFSELVPNEKLILVRNENYWSSDNGVQLPYLDAVEYLLYSPGETEKMLLDFRTGKLDECTHDVAKLLEDLAELDEQGNLNLQGWLRDKSVQFVQDSVFRKLRYMEIFESNKKVRQAMSYSVDRKRLVEGQQSVFQNYETARGPIAPNTIYFNPELKGQYYDPDQARRLLAEAGFPDGKGLPEYPFYYAPGPDADQVVGNLRSLGFKIRKINKHPGWREVFERPGPLLAWMRNQTTSPEAYDVLDLVDGQPECMTDSVFWGAFQEWRKNEENFKNLDLLHRVEEIACDLTPQVFLYHIGGDFRFLQSYVRGRQLGNAWGHKLHYVWLDKGK